MPPFWSASPLKGDEDAARLEYQLRGPWVVETNSSIGWRTLLRLSQWACQKETKQCYACTGKAIAA